MRFERRMGIVVILAAWAASSCEEGPKYHPKDGGTDSDAPIGSGGGAATTAGRGSGGVAGGGAGFLGNGAGGSVSPGGSAGNGSGGMAGTGMPTGSGASAGTVGATGGTASGGNGTGGIVNVGGGGVGPSATGGSAGSASTGGTAGGTSIGGAGGGACAVRDCLNGFGCAAGVCKKSCSNNNDCQPDYFCDVSNGACHSDVVSVACGTYHTCAALKDGRVMCWGDNTAGELGIGTTDAAKGAVPVHGVTKAALVRANEYATCVLTVDGTVSCWGNYFGDNPATFLAATTPIPVTTSTGPLTGAKLLELGYNDGCAVATNGTYCWGRNASASLGIDPSQQDVYPATPLVGAGIPSSLGLGGGLQVAAYGATSVCPWSGQAPQGQCFDVGGKVAQLAVGQQTTCARRDDGVVICWGNNTYGQVGPAGTGTTVDPPGAQLPGLKASDLVAGTDFGCAIKSDDPRTIACWGHTSAAIRLTTPAIATGVQVAKLGSGDKAFSFCGILTDGSLLCWDYSGTPQQVPTTW